MTRFVLLVALSLVATGCLSRRIVATNVRETIDHMVFKAGAAAAVDNRTKLTLELSSTSTISGNVGGPIGPVTLGVTGTLAEGTKVTVSIENLQAAYQRVVNTRAEEADKDSLMELFGKGGPSEALSKYPEPPIYYYDPDTGKLYDHQAPWWRRWLF